MEEWHIKISEDGKQFFFSRYINGIVNEQYAPVSVDKASIYCAAVIHGFQPPRNLIFCSLKFAIRK